MTEYWVGFSLASFPLLFIFIDSEVNRFIIMAGNSNNNENKVTIFYQNIRCLRAKLQGYKIYEYGNPNIQISS